MRHRHYLLALVLKNISSRQAIQQIHAQLITTAFPSIALWSSLLRHYSLGSFPEESLLIFKHLQLQHSPLFFDSYAYSFLIKACANLGFSQLGSQLHSLTVKAGFEFHVYVQTALLNMYAVCGSLGEAHQVFDEMPDRNLVTWNALITGLMKWGEIGLARALFDRMPSQNVVSWTGIIDGYARLNQYHEALFLFRRMAVEKGIKPTEVTILAILPAIWNTGCLESCQLVHPFGEKSGFIESDIRVANSLIDTYAKCGCIESAAKVFEGIGCEKRNLVSWTSIISGFAMHGMGKQAANSFKRMEDECLKPNRVTFLSILNACSHGGLVEEGLVFFRKMVNECQVEPDIKHYGCLVDMLGRAGTLEEAEKIALQIPNEIENVVIWRTLLGACSFHGNIQMGERVMRKILDMEKRYGGDYVLLSNIFAGFGRFEDAERVRRLMDESNAPKVPGLSSS
ncbi:Pentatricopeptide repeat-containing protein [Actinidia chinensis var. chinensis]|uniref:Pentatricopeptide repeat-containing protein n=1 Tax=Actinidia chinensis var. chinensis TaxID=1590841 RepID=A0A2R6P3N9_ACTCC|nr:Pentatricopeptide repeat-containing protein [Actinidia chinensis var. chinensis]